MSTTNIQCGCGAVKLAIEGDPVGQLYCHCADCRKVHGGAYIPMALYKAEAVKVEGDTSTWALVRTPRVSCPKCSTRLFAELTGMGMRALTATLLPEGQFKPGLHLWCKEALAPVKDSLPHFEDYPASFGGSDKQVSW